MFVCAVMATTFISSVTDKHRASYSKADESAIQQPRALNRVVVQACSSAPFNVAV